MKPPSPPRWTPRTLEEAQEFQASLCARCRHDQAWRSGEGMLKAKGGCAVLAATLACRIGDPYHPQAWTKDEAGFTCQHFEDIAEQSQGARCPRSIDMFEEALPLAISRE